MQRYVVGFMFDIENPNRVALIRKNRPFWQAGKLNGIGGSIEPAEMPDEAMAREFYEETGYRTLKDDWLPFVEIPDAEYKLYCFTRYGVVDWVRSNTDEEVVIYDWHCLDAEITVSKLLWLIPMAHLHLRGQQLYTHIIEAA